MFNATKVSSGYGWISVILIAAFLIVTVFKVPAFAGPDGTGKITGSVVDSETGEALLGVSIYVEGT